MSLLSPGQGQPPLPTREPTCPSCARRLEPFSIDDLQVVSCPRCKGMWLTQEELEAALRRGHMKLEDLTKSTGSYTHTFHRSPSSRGCPVCEQAMDNYQFEDNSGIWIDACPHGHGTWLDGGELELLWYHRQRREGQMTLEEIRLSRSMGPQRFRDQPPGQ